jgi:hypothetical protein
VDLSQAGGRAILGWNCGSANTAFKNTFNRGVHFATESAEVRQVERAVNVLLPGFVRVCSAEEVRLDSLWRPWGNLTTEGTEDTEGRFFLPPFPLASAYAVCVSRVKVDGVAAAPCFLAGMTRAVYDLIAELPKRGEAGWGRYDRFLLPFFERRGPYLYPKMSEAEYPAFIAKCLSAGLVISPDYMIPSIIPWGANPGDFKGLEG